MANKLPVAEQATLRKKVYNLALDGVSTEYEVETVAEGALVHLPDGQFAVIKVVYKDPTKFDLNETREAYVEKCLAEKARQEKAIDTARKKAEKEAKKAEKAVAKVADDTQ